MSQSYTSKFSVPCMGQGKVIYNDVKGEESIL